MLGGFVFGSLVGFVRRVFIPAAMATVAEVARLLRSFVFGRLARFVRRVLVTLVLFGSG